IGEDTYSMINIANKQTEELFSLLDNLLKWTKSQIGRLNVVYQDFVIDEMIAGVIDIFSTVAKVKNISLKYERSESDGLEVHADIDMCKTVFRNLLSNAIKFSESGSSIEVYTYHENGMLIVNVRDHGCGMSEEDQKRLFNTETHFTKYGTANEEGSGLGLLLCKDFVEKNGGRLTLQSVEGEGSTFSFSVPLSQKGKSQVS
ncbi:MAG: HAMP domain-containing histidine kinase, partial [Bacteroidaceae bacterium]|nr:HAMP domain-containing histidine kinase [Bacteroidaceae bacterium]